MTSEARVLAQALLDHHQKVCPGHGESTLNVDSCVITYGELCERGGVPHLKPTVGKFLREIAQWCDENGWPPLNSLAVNHDTRKPGQGYDGAPGCSLEHWPHEVAACVKFQRYPDSLPE
jgi:hypothetical protein